MGRYRLRAELKLQADAQGRWLLRDPTLRRAMRLGARDSRLLRQLRRGATIEQLREQGETSAEVAARLSALGRHYVLQGSRSERRIALERERLAFARQLEGEATGAGGEVTLHTPPWRDPPKHACVSSGACCKATFLGPLVGDDKRRISELTLGRRASVNSGAEALESVEFRGQTLWGMRREASRCVAQGDDLYCDIHVEHGAQAKPVACRQFPLRLHRTPWGVSVSLLLACEGYERARDSGAPWAERRAELQGLIAEGAPLPAVTLPFEWTAGLPVSVQQTRELLDDFIATEPHELTDPRGWLAQLIDDFESKLATHSAALREGAEVSLYPCTVGLAARLRDDASWIDAQVLSAQRDDLLPRAAHLEAAQEFTDAERLRVVLRGLEALEAGLQLAPRGEFSAAPTAIRHLMDVIANDLPAKITVGQIDAGLSNLCTRLLFVEALACALARDDDRAEVSGADTTAALKVAYRSEPVLSALTRLSQR